MSVKFQSGWRNPHFCILLPKIPGSQTFSKSTKTFVFPRGSGQSEESLTVPLLRNQGI